MMTISTLGVLLNPIEVSSDPRENSRRVEIGASGSPTHDSDDVGPVIAFAPTFVPSIKRAAAVAY